MIFSFRRILYLYLLLGLLLLPFYQYQINPDGVSYIGIAQKYLTGNLQDALNGYWGLMYPLALAPFLALPVTPLFATKLLALVTGIFFLWGFYSLLDLFQLTQKHKRLTTLTLVIPTLYYGYSVITSDLLLCTILLFYLRAVLDHQYFRSFKPAFLSGLLGGLAVLTKQYALVFFLSTFIVTSLAYWIAEKPYRMRIIVNFLIGLAVFTLIIGLWSLALTSKYGYFTLGTTGQYNMAAFGRTSQGQYPFDKNTLIAPPNQTAVSIWEDPSFIKLQPWNPLASFQDLKYQFFMIRENFPRIITFLETSTVLALWIIIQSAISLMSSGKTLIRQSKISIFVVLTSLLFYILGYSLIVVQERYLWIAFALVLLLGTVQSEIIINSGKTKTVTGNFILLVLLISFLVSPAFNLIKGFNIDKNYFDQGQVIKKQIGIDGANLASNTMGPPTELLAFHSNNRYFGQTGDYQDTNDLINLLRKKSIDYYLIWESPAANKEIGTYLSEISTNTLSEIKIYRVK